MQWSAKRLCQAFEVAVAFAELKIVAQRPALPALSKLGQWARTTIHQTAPSAMQTEVVPPFVLHTPWPERYLTDSTLFE